MNDKSTYFYGIDFKKIKLYCKVNTLDAIKTKQNYLKLNKYIKINSDQYYEVIIIDFHDEFLSINVSYKVKVYNYKNSSFEYTEEDYMKIYLNFSMVEFAYFFENTKEDYLKSIQI